MKPSGDVNDGDYDVKVSNGRILLSPYTGWGVGTCLVFPSGDVDYCNFSGFTNSYGFSPDTRFNDYAGFVYSDGDVYYGGYHLVYYSYGRLSRYTIPKFIQKWLRSPCTRGTSIAYRVWLDGIVDYGDTIVDNSYGHLTRQTIPKFYNFCS